MSDLFRRKQSHTQILDPPLFSFLTQQTTRSVFQGPLPALSRPFRHRPLFPHQSHLAPARPPALARLPARRPLLLRRDHRFARIRIRFTISIFRAMVRNVLVFAAVCDRSEFNALCVYQRERLSLVLKPPPATSQSTEPSRSTIPMDRSSSSM